MSNESTTTDLVEVDAPKVFEFKAYRYEEFVKIVDKANRRLQRAGGNQLFAFSFETFEREVRRPSRHIYGSTEGTGVFAPWFRATLTSDWRISAGNHTFIATLIAEEAGYTVHTAPGQSLDGWVRPDVNDIHCDVCSTVRRRINIYIVRDETTGKLIQVGTNCLAPLLGFSPESLWALTWTENAFAALADSDDDEDEDKLWGSYRGTADRTVAVDRVLAIAWAVSSGGVNYTSTKAADAYYDKTGGERTIPTTVSKIRAHLAGRPRPWKGDDSEGQAWDKIQALVEAVTETQILDVKVVGETLQAGTDYADNMHTILAGERVTFRNIGILGSLVSVYARELDRAQERAAKAETDPIAKGWIGQDKERIRNFSITLTTVKEFERDSFSGYGTETATMIIGRTADGHVVKWVYAGTVSYEVGDVITVKAGTVKKQDTWNGIDQTVLNRVVVSD